MLPVTTTILLILKIQPPNGASGARERKSLILQKIVILVHASSSAFSSVSSCTCFNRARLSFGGDGGLFASTSA